MLHLNTINQGRPFKPDSRPFALRHFNSGKLLLVDTVTGKTYLEFVGGEQLDPESPIKNSLRLIELQKGEKYLFANSNYRIIANQEPLTQDDEDIMEENEEILPKKSETKDPTNANNNAKSNQVSQRSRRAQFGSQIVDKLLEIPQPNPQCYLSHIEYELNINSIKETHLAQNIVTSCMFNPLDDKDFEEEKLLAKFTETLNVEQAFSFTKIAEKERTSILFLRSALPGIKKVTNIYKHNREMLLKNETLVQMEAILRRLLCFLFKKDYIEDE